MIGTTRMGRPPKGVEHVDSVAGSAQAKERLKHVLLSLHGDLTREEAAHRIGISERRLRQLRDAVLTAAVASLEPGRPGRPRRARPTPQEELLKRLEGEANVLAWELTVSRVREELALLMPSVSRVAAAGPGGTGKPRSSGARRPRGAARKATKRG